MCTIMRNFHYIRTGLIYHFCWFPDIVQNFLKQTRQKSGALEINLKTSHWGIHILGGIIIFQRNNRSERGSRPM